MDVKLDEVDIVKDRTGVSYGEAKEALEQSNGSIVDAIVKVEEMMNSKFDKLDVSAIKDNPVYIKAKDLVEKGNISRIIIRKGDNIIVNFPLTASILGAVIIPWPVIFGIAAAVGFKCNLEFVDSNGKVTDINGAVVGTYNKVTTEGKKVVDKIVESDAYKAGKEKASKAWEEMTKEGGYLDQMGQTLEKVFKKGAEFVKEKYEESGLKDKLHGNSEEK